MSDMIVYVVTMNHEDGNHSVWTNRDAAFTAAQNLVRDDERVYEAWVEEWETDTGDGPAADPVCLRPER